MSAKYIYKRVDEPFRYIYKIVRRKKLKTKEVFRRVIYKMFPYGESIQAIIQMDNEPHEYIDKETAEKIKSDSEEFKKEFYEETDFVEKNGLFFRIIPGNSKQQLKERHTASVFYYKGKKYKIPTYDLAEILSQFSKKGDYDALMKYMNGYGVLTMPEHIEIFWYLYALKKGYPSFQERLDYYYFDSQPKLRFPTISVKIPRERVLDEYDSSLWDATPIYQDIDNRVLESDAYVTLRYSSGYKCTAKVVIKNNHTIVEGTEYGTAIFVMPVKYFFSQNGEVDLDLIREYKRFNHSKTVMERVGNYIREKNKESENVRKQE